MNATEAVAKKVEDATLSTGTTTLAIVCKDGLVLAADKRATAGYMIANKRTEKIQQIADKIFCTQSHDVLCHNIRLILAQKRKKDLKLYAIPPSGADKIANYAPKPSARPKFLRS